MLGGTQSLGWVCLIGICVVWGWHMRGMGVAWAGHGRVIWCCYGHKHGHYLLGWKRKLWCIPFVKIISMLSHICALVPNNHAARHGDELALETSLCKYPKNKSMPRCRLAAYIFWSRIIDFPCLGHDDKPSDRPYLLAITTFVSVFY